MNKKQKKERLLRTKFRINQRKNQKKEFVKKLREKIEKNEIRFFQPQAGVIQTIFVHPVQFKSAPLYIHNKSRKHTMPCHHDDNCHILPGIKGKRRGDRKP